MHIESLNHMTVNIAKYLLEPTNILDVGSLNVKKKGCYKQIIDLNKHSYIGIDLTAGRNVDIVTTDPYVFPFPDNHFGAVLSGQCFEHCPNMFKLMNECARVLKPGGVFLGVAPYKWPEHHRKPYDCWRILGDGWKVLFEDAKLTTLETYYVDMNPNADSWGIARK